MQAFAPPLLTERWRGVIFSLGHTLCPAPPHCPPVHPGSTRCYVNMRVCNMQLDTVAALLGLQARRLLYHPCCFGTHLISSAPDTPVSRPTLHTRPLTNPSARWSNYPVKPYEPSPCPQPRPISESLHKSQIYKQLQPKKSLEKRQNMRVVCKQVVEDGVVAARAENWLI